uniref:lectin-like protein n=1 Tax=Crocosphaera sp. TaxID=2729996 RepID=UPI00262C28AD
MNTKLAIELLAEFHNDLTAFLSGLGLLNNETAINYLKTVFDAAFQVFLDDYDNLKAKLTVTSSQIETVEESLTIADDYYRVEEERLQNLLADKAALVSEIEIFEEQKESIEKFSDEEKLVIQAKVDEIKEDIFETEATISQLRQNPNSNKQQIYVLERELNAHILRYSLQKDLLSLSGLDTAQKLESVKLQIQQQTEDLETLNNQDIVEQETIVNNANQNLSDLQSELEELQATANLAETELTNFETINAYLLAEDVTEFLDWNIDEDTPEVVKLWQQYLAVEGEEIISERLTSLQSQVASEESVTLALEADSIEGYVILGAELAEEIESLSAIWLENLQESHQLTVDVWNLSEKRTEAVNELETYIEDNLADPEGEYLLDKIQLQEAIARQEAQVNYADALGESVDSLEEAIAVLTTQQQQVNLLSEKINHISKLTTYEQGYAALQDILNRLDSVNESDYQSSNEQVIKVTEELIDFLSSNKQFPEIVDQLNEILNNYKSFYQANSEIYSNKYQTYINIDTQKNIDLDIVSDNKKQVQEQALSKGAKLSNVTGNYYFIGHSVNNWYAARNEGTAAGGHLVAINSWEEQRWLNKNFGYLTYWIGLTDEVSEGHWRWVNGEPITFTNWIPGEPNNKRNEDYAYSYGSGKWNDVDPITDWGGSKRGLIEINYSLFDQQIKEINYQAIADQAIVADEIDALHDQGIKLLINQTSEILRPLLINKLDDEINNKTQGLVSEIDLEISSINYLTSQITVEYEGKKYYGELTYDNSALKYQAEEWLSGDNIKEFSFNFLGKTYTRNDFYWSEKGISLGFFDGDPVAALFAFNTPDGHNFGFGQESNSNINWSNGFLQWDFNNSKWIENVGTLDFSDPANTEILEQQEQWLETNLQNYIEQKQNNFTQDITNQEKKINNLQNLRVEIAYLTLQAEQNPDKLQNYLEEYFNPIGDGSFSEYINTSSHGSFL